MDACVLGFGMEWVGLGELFLWILDAKRLGLVWINVGLGRCRGLLLWSLEWIIRNGVSFDPSLPGHYQA